MNAEAKNRFAEVLLAAALTSYMVGAEAVAREYIAATPRAELRNDWKQPAQYLREKRILTEKEFDDLEFGYRRFAFTLTDVAERNLIERTRDLLAKSLDAGGSLGSWRAAVDKAFASAGADPLNPAYAETVYRTNVASAYGAANWDMLHHPAVAEEFPLLLFDGVGDDRQSDICRPADGVVLPRDDPFWETHWPPLHFRCRSTVRPVHRDDAAGLEITRSIPSSAPEEGFGLGGGAREQWTKAEEIARG